MIFVGMRRATTGDSYFDPTALHTIGKIGLGMGLIYGHHHLADLITNQVRCHLTSDLLVDLAKGIEGIPIRAQGAAATQTVSESRPQL